MPRPGRAVASLPAPPRRSPRASRASAGAGVRGIGDGGGERRRRGRRARRGLRTPDSRPRRPRAYRDFPVPDTAAARGPGAREGVSDAGDHAPRRAVVALRRGVRAHLRVRGRRPRAALRLGGAARHRHRRGIRQPHAVLRGRRWTRRDRPDSRSGLAARAPASRSRGDRAAQLDERRPRTRRGRPSAGDRHGSRHLGVARRGAAGGLRARGVGAHPRGELAAEFGACVTDQASRKPETAARRLLDGGVLAKLAANPLEGVARSVAAQNS